jgi:branched-chain amino acid aminotransferase
LEKQYPMTAPLAYLNGTLVPFADAALPLHDAGFVSGATVVDNARTFRHTLFRWPDHLARFSRDCAACYVHLSPTDAQLTAAAEELVAHNAKLLPPGGELQLVTFATPGPLGFYLGDQPDGPATLGMVTYPLPFGRYRRFFTDGVRLSIAGFHASMIDGELLPPTIKHRSRMHWHIAAKRVADPTSPHFRPGTVPVVLNEYGHPDTAVGGVCGVYDGQLVFPPEYGVQESISFRVLRELAASLGIGVLQTVPLDLRLLYLPVEPEPLFQSLPRWSELLLAGTGFCVAGVRECGRMAESRPYAWPGPVFSKLLAAWSDLVGVDVAAQFGVP